MSNSNGFHGTKRAVFLDRDGTINIEKDYLYRVEDFEFIPGAPEAIGRLKAAGWLVVVVSNQSGVARGYYHEQDVHTLHRHIASLLSAYGTVDGWYFCPHHESGREPYNQMCGCRKPLPGMLLAAARELDIDLTQSWMVGDKLVDVEAGRAAGCKTILVRTGYGAQYAATPPDDSLVCDDLQAVADLITSI